MNNAGNEIKMLREKKGHSLEELEHAIGVPAGSLVRIESGLTYPTPETLQKIADALELNEVERTYLFMKPITEVSTGDIQKAVKDLAPMVKNHPAPAYLHDYRRNIYCWSDISVKLFGVSPELYRYEYPNLLTIWFEHAQSFKKIFGERQYVRIGTDMLRRTIQELSYVDDEWLQSFLQSMKGNEEFINTMNIVNAQSKTKILNDYTVVMQSSTESLNFIASKSSYVKDLRFLVVWYHPQNQRTEEYIDKLMDVQGITDGVDFKSTPAIGAQ